VEHSLKRKEHIINISDYFRRLHRKYKFIKNQPIMPGSKDASPDLGTALGIKHGKVKKQLSAKTMKENFDHKKFTVKGDK